MSDQHRDGLNRRGFLRAGIGSATAVAGATAVPVVAKAAEGEAEQKKARYKETDHVKAYYRVNRY